MIQFHSGVARETTSPFSRSQTSNRNSVNDSLLELLPGPQCLLDNRCDLLGHCRTYQTPEYPVIPVSFSSWDSLDYHGDRTLAYVSEPCCLSFIGCCRLFLPLNPPDLLCDLLGYRGTSSKPSNPVMPVQGYLAHERPRPPGSL